MSIQSNLQFSWSFLRNFVRWNIEAFPPKPQYSADDVPDLTGRVAIVTGGSGGIGKEIVKALLRKNAKVYTACRNKEKANTAIAELKDETGKEAILLELDLADLKSVKRAVEQFRSQESALHFLFNNGGVMWPPLDMLTAQGYDLQFGTNVLGHFYFTKLLIPQLVEGSKSSPDGKARVVILSSIVRHLARNIDYETLRDGPKRRRTDTRILYSQSKFADTALSREFARRYGDQNIVFTAAAPGILKTELTRHASKVSEWFIRTIYMYEPSYGALTPLHAGTSPETLNANGAFFVPWARLSRAESAGSGKGSGSDDPEKGVELWDWLEEQVKDV